LVGLPKAALSGSLNFGLVCAGGSSDLQFTVTNTGTAPLTISSVSIGVGTPGLSVLSPPTLPQTLAIGASLTFTVRFTPAPGFTGAIVGTVNVSTDDPVNPTQSLPISGTVGAPVATIGASAIDFGGVATDNRTVPSTSDRTVTINNTGSCALKVTSASITAGGTDFSIVGAPTLPVTVGAGSSITLTIRFNPTAAGTRTGTLTVGTNDAANPSQAVSLTGLGLLPAIQLSPSAVVFPPTVILSQVPGYTGRTANLTVTNVGQAELIVDSMTTSGSPFSAVPATAPPARYATNDHYDEPVTFAPSAVGKFTGSFTVSDNNSEGGPISANAPLCGEGVGRGIRVLAVDGSGAPIQQLQRVHLQSHGTAVGVNVNLKNVSLVPVTTSCTAGEQRHYENQSLPATDTVNQQSSYYNLDVTAGGKATSITFTLGVSEFKTLIVTVK
jgi:hypothetical protein